MAASVGQLNVKVTASSAGLDSGLMKAESRLTRFAGKVSAGIGSGIATLGTLGAAAAAAGTAIAASAVVAGASLGVKLAADAEQAAVAFEVMLGSAEKAKSVLKDINTFAAATPFETPELIDASKRLLAFGVSAEKLGPTLKTLGDVSAGTGKDLGELAVIFGQIKLAGRLMGGDMLQLVNAGIPVASELAKHFGVLESDIKGMVETGRVGFTDVAKVMENLAGTGGRFENMMAKQSQTVSGKFSTLSDNVKLSLMEVGVGLTEGLNLKGLLDDAGRFVDEGKKLFAVFGKEVVAAFTATGLTADDARKAVLFFVKSGVQSLAYIIETAKLFAGAWAKYVVAPVAQGTAELAVLFGKDEFARDANRAAIAASKFGDELLKTTIGSGAAAVEAAFDRIEKRVGASADVGEKFKGSIVEAVPVAQQLATAMQSVGSNTLAGVSALDAFGARVAALQANAQSLMSGGGLVATKALSPADFLKGASRIASLRNQAFGALVTPEDIKTAERLALPAVQAAVEKFATEVWGAFLVGLDPSKTRELERAGNVFGDAIAAFGRGESGQAALAATKDLAKELDSLRLFGVDTANIARGLNAVTASFGKLESLYLEGSMANSLKALRGEFDKFLDAEAWKVFAGTRTPLEKFRTTLDDLGALVRSGKIDWDTYGRAVRNALDEMKTDDAGKLAPLIERQSAEALSLRNRLGHQQAMTRGNETPEARYAREAAEKLKAIEQVQRQALRLLEKLRPLEMAGGL